MDYRLERVTSESHFRKKVISAAQKVMGSLGEHFKLQCLVSASGQRGWQNLRGVYSTWLANRRKKKKKERLGQFPLVSWSVGTEGKYWSEIYFVLAYFLTLQPWTLPVCFFSIF